MGRLVDVDDLIDSAEVARICGLGNRNSVRIYRERYPDFPTPVVELGEGRCLIFLRPEVDEWNGKHPRRSKREGAG